jgi:uncharacterized protein YndB with AHSA1/START domain
MALVEADRRHLRVEVHVRPAAPAGFLQQCQQQGIANAASAPWRAHRHPADVAIRGQPRGADRGAVEQAGEGVRAQRIQRIVLEFGRHPLLADEHFVAHRAQFRQRGGEIHQLHAERLQRRIAPAHASFSGGARR